MNNHFKRNECEKPYIGDFRRNKISKVYWNGFEKENKASKGSKENGITIDTRRWYILLENGELISPEHKLYREWHNKLELV